MAATPIVNNPNRTDGTGNPFTVGFSDQCTFWAQERYHTLTGIWTPCTGNGYQWASQAGAHGWIITSQPPNNQPSIICLQPNIQGADRNFGHVGVVERINSDGSVYTSNYNVYPHLGDKVVVYLTFHTGNGVSFIFAGTGVGSLSKTVQFVNTIGNSLSTLGTTYSLSSNPTVRETLIGIDNVLDINNPFDIQSTLNPLDWLGQLGNNFVKDIVSIILRIILFSLGTYILIKIFSYFIDFAGIAQTIGSTATKVAPLVV